MAKAKIRKKSDVDGVAFPKLAFMTLYDVRIDIEPVEDPSDSGLNYDVSVTSPKKSFEEKHAFRCEIAVGRKKSDTDENFIEVGATYGCLLDANDLDEENLLNVAKLYAGTAAWNAFSSLFAVVSQQMKVEFPPLPPFPGNVTLRPEHDGDDEDHLAVLED